MSSHRAALHTLNNTVPYHSHSMTSSAHSPVNKMAQPQRTASQDSSADGIRKRVCKACDRCRLKKSKCDGSHPCSRCKADNAICVFGERKKSHDKVYPKGYVEMLEQQQSQLVSGLQEMYRRLVSADAWKGAPLAEASGNPLTHDILAALELLDVKHDGSGEVEAFEEDCEKLQSRLLADGAGYTSHHRRGSISSDSEHSQHSQHSHGRSHSHGTPTISKSASFKDTFNFSSQPPTPAMHSPVPSQRRSFPPPTSQPSPLQHSSPLNNDPQLYQAEWAYPEASGKFMMRSDYAVQTPELDQNMGGLGGFGQWDNTSPSFDMTQSGITSYPQLSNSLGNTPKLQDGTLGSIPMGDPMLMEMEFNQFISVMT